MPTVRRTTLPWGYSIAVLAALLLLGGTLLYVTRDEPQRPIPDPPPNYADIEQLKRTHPHLDETLKKFNIHSIVVAEEQGRQVVKLRVAAEGDELVLDAATGKLIEARPYHKPHGPMAPIGKTPMPIPM